MFICACNGVVVNDICSASEHKSNLRSHQEGHSLKMFLKVTLLMMFINLISVIDLFVDFIFVFC